MIWNAYHPEFHTFLSSCLPHEYFFSNYKDWTTSDGEVNLPAFIYYTAKYISKYSPIWPVFASRDTLILLQMRALGSLVLRPLITVGENGAGFLKVFENCRKSLILESPCTMRYCQVCQMRSSMAFWNVCIWSVEGRKRRIPWKDTVCIQAHPFFFVFFIF